MTFRTYLLLLGILLCPTFLFCQSFEQHAVSGFPTLRHSEAKWADFNNDGYLDIIITGATATGDIFTGIFRNNGDGTFTRTGSGISAVNRASISIGDYNRDGLPDILISGINEENQRLTNLYKNTGNFSFASDEFNFENVAYGGAVLKDLNNDGLPDVVLNGWDSRNIPVFKMYKNTGHSFEEINSGITPTFLGDITVFDYNNNGRNDLLISGSTMTNTRVTRLFRNNGYFSFTNINFNFEGVDQGHLASSDLNNDGYQDIIIAGRNTSNQKVLKIYLNNMGDDTFEELNHSMPAVSPAHIATGDLNNNGFKDIIITGSDNENDITTALYTNNGDQTFSSSPNPFPDIQDGSISIGDYDNDQKPDVLIFGMSAGALAGRLYKNTSTVAPANVTPPDDLTSEPDGNSVTFNWEYSDTSVLPNDYTYDIYLGTSSGGRELFSPLADINNGQPRVAKQGNFNAINELTINNLPKGTYYWGIQAVDAAFNRSGFSTENSFTIGEEQSITFSPLDSTSYGEVDFELTAEASSGLPVTYSAVPDNIISIEDNTVTVLNAGEVTIIAEQEGDDIYFPAEAVERTLVIKKASLHATANDTSRHYGTNNPELTGTVEGLKYEDPISLELSTDATKDSDVGTYDIITSLSDPEERLRNYEVSLNNAILTIDKAPQSIEYSPVNDQHVENQLEIELSSTSGLGVLLEVEKGPATIEGNTATFTGLGNVKIIASQPGNHNYHAAEPVILAFEVFTDKEMTVSLTADKNEICKNEEVTFTAEVMNGGTNPSYQWFVNGVLITSAETSTYSTSTLRNEDYVQVIVTADNDVIVVEPHKYSSEKIISVKPIPEATITVEGYTLHATEGAHSYEWFLNGSLLEENTASINAYEEGLYKVIVHSEAGCSDTSEQVNATVTVSSLLPDSENFSVSIFPNPVTDILFIETKQQNTPVDIEIFNLQGVKVMDKKTHKGESQKTDIRHLSAGTYIITITTEDTKAAFKIVKQ
ncbi:FG-GAP-like repeat-containing protein [Cytophagaceae bacterium ABcell3]|nr:FG-GAP-like repeat-containing protein [Cytophagaceae bacterium ABcell3]